MHDPLISVLMGVYHPSADIELLERSVHSVLAQTVQDFEFLICDDGSSHEACHFLENLAGREERLRLIRKGNLFSLPVKLNACLREARGTWVARMDDDDYSAPQRFEVQLAYLREHPEISFVGSNVTLRRNGQSAGEWRFPEYPTVQDFYFRQPFIHPTLMLRRDVLLSIGGYSEDKRCVLCEDYDLLLRLYAAGCAGANVQHPLLEYSLPATAGGNRRMRHRWNEAVTRYRRFRDLGALPAAWPYVVKPLAVGLLPEGVLRRLKGWRCRYRT